MKWTGYLVSEQMGTIYPLESDYSAKKSAIENAPRCVEEQTGAALEPCPVVVFASIESSDGENMGEIIELLARDLVEATDGVTQGFGVGPVVDVRPRPADLVARELKGKGRFARYVMEALAEMHMGDVDVMLEDFGRLQTC